MAAKWVLDCSAVAAMVFSEKEGIVVAEIFEQSLKNRIHILTPPLFWYEIGNVLVVGVRRKRIAGNCLNEILARLFDLPVETDAESGVAVYQRIMGFANLHNLSFYDAAYLELADRIGARLKTFDKQILKLKSHYPWIQ